LATAGDNRIYKVGPHSGRCGEVSQSAIANNPARIESVEEGGHGRRLIDQKIKFPI